MSYKILKRAYGENIAGLISEYLVDQKKQLLMAYIRKVAINRLIKGCSESDLKSITILGKKIVIECDNGNIYDGYNKIEFIKYINTPPYRITEFSYNELRKALFNDYNEKSICSEMFKQ